jgi:cell division septation protein DedD
MTSERPDQPMKSKVIGQRYEILRPLREEPWGEVWLAQDKVLGVEVGLKLLAKEAPDWAAARKILKEEAILALTLRHPQVLGVFSLGEMENLLYLVQEPFAGENLMTQLSRHLRPGLLQVLSVLEQVGEALAVAHRQGLAHQSLNPLHILTRGEEVRVANFAFPARDEDQVTHLELKAYHPPEVLKGEAVTPAGNIFSLGVLGFRLVAGSLPYPLTFDEPFPYRLETPPVDLEEIPIPLQNVLLRCLAVEPEERFADAGAFLAQLRQIREPWRSGQPESAATWELERRRAAWRQGPSVTEVGGKLWAAAKSGFGKIQDLAHTQGPKLGRLPRRLWWGLGLAGLIIAVLLVGVKVRRPLPPPTVPAAPVSAMKLPPVAGGPPALEAERPASIPETPEAGGPPTSETPSGTPPEAKAPPREERYIVMAATFAREDQARALARRLKGNYPSRIVKRSSQGKVSFQVVVGPITGAKQAEEVAARIKDQEKITPKVQKLAAKPSSAPSRQRTAR